MKWARRSVVLALALTIAACGGGGDIGGTIVGLTADGLVLSNGSETLAVAKDATTFAFANTLADGTVYSVTVVTQPTGLHCTVTGGTGIVKSADVAPDVQVDCVAVFTVGGTVSGLRGAGLVLGNGHEEVAVASGAPIYSFPTPLAAGASYDVVVVTQPASQTCSVANGTGIVGDSAVTDVALECR